MKIIALLALLQTTFAAFGVPADPPILALSASSLFPLPASLWVLLVLLVALPSVALAWVMLRPAEVDTLLARFAGPGPVVP